MIQFIRSILGLCNHNWLVVNEGPVVQDNEVIGFWVRSKCSKCGAHKYKQYC